MRLRSLSTRLLVISLAWSVFALAATAVVLVSTFRVTVQNRFDETVNVHLNNLLRELTPENVHGDGPVMDLAEPRFQLPFSGLYWLAIDPNTGTVLRTSESLIGDEIDMAVPAREIPCIGPFTTDARGPVGDSLRVVARRVLLADVEPWQGPDCDGPGWTVIAVAANNASIGTDTARFATRLGVVLGLFAATLLAVTFIQVRVGLRPLKKLGGELKAIQAGSASRVTGSYPSEIAPVGSALNILIDANHATLERARRHVGNLAHALKTPISVLQNDAVGSGPLPATVREQTQIMQRQVRHYLERAQMAAKERVIGTVTDTAPVMERLVNAMRRLGDRRGIDVRLEPSQRLLFAGERQDFEEIVGNLMDNALKWARSEVVVSLAPLPDRRRFTLTISDDGPGLEPEEATAVLSRGKRLDTSKPGSGLGLSIVSELVSLYGGVLRMGRSEAGGLAAVVELPRA